MRENIEAIRELFTMEEVTYEGEFVTLDRVRIRLAIDVNLARSVGFDAGIMRSSTVGGGLIADTGEIHDQVDDLGLPSARARFATHCGRNLGELVFVLALESGLAQLVAQRWYLT